MEADESTEVIVLISKPPSPRVQSKVFEKVEKDVTKPCVACFLGGTKFEKLGDKLYTTETLEEAAYAAVALLKGEEPKKVEFAVPEERVSKVVEEELSRKAKGQRYVRGLFSGGTLCSEALVVLTRYFPVYSNVSYKRSLKLESPLESKEHTCVDLGAEEFVAGRPHPMIDYTVRKRRILKEARDPSVSVLLLDVVLGYGAHPNPSKELEEAIAKAREVAEREGRHLTFVASITGTPDDPQNRDHQKEVLERCGVVVMPTNAQASKLAALIASRSS